MRIRLEEATAQFAPEVSSALVRRQQTNNRGRPGFHGGTRCRAGYVPRRRRHCRAGYVHAPAVRSSVDGLPAGRKTLVIPAARQNACANDRCFRRLRGCDAPGRTVTSVYCLFRFRQGAISYAKDEQWYRLFVQTGTTSNR